MRERSLYGLVFISLIFIIVTSCTLAPTSINPASGIPDGTYTIDNNKLKLQSDHFTILTTFDQELSQGSFVITGNRIQFTETDFALECGAQYSPYSYQWAFDGKLLNFSNPDDQCLGRVTFMTNTPWVLSNSTP